MMVVDVKENENIKGKKETCMACLYTCIYIHTSFL